MSWDPNAGYDGYGNYSDQPQQPPQDYGGANGAGSYEMQFDNNSGWSNQPPQPQSGSSSFYNPNEYSQQQQQPPATSNSYYAPPPMPTTPQAGFRPPGPTNAYRSSPVPNVPSGQPGSQMPNFAIPGLGGANVNPVMTDMAMRYGQDMMGKGQEELKKNLEQYVSIGELKYYFAVDTNYVAKKLGLLLFPFSHSDWSIRYSQDEPVQPKYDVNAPDLYIPSMAYLTYILLVGYVFGLRNAFSPDALAATASSALVWLVLELVVIWLSLQLMNIGTNLCKWDIISFCTYKYVGMIALVAVGLVARSSMAYYIALAYISAALAFFLMRTLKLRIEPEVHGMQMHGKRKVYMILFYAGVQPFLMWWMTHHLLITDVVVMDLL